MNRRPIALLAALLLAAAGFGQVRAAAAGSAVEILNVSYDPTRELWRDLDAAFIRKYESDQPAQRLSIKQSHGGSSSQARAVIEGLDADVVTLAMWPHVDAIRKAGLIAAGWEQRLPNNSVPYVSTIVFVVRKGNPKGIKDWPDIVKPGVQVVTPNPKTSGNGKLSFLAAWGSVIQRGGSEQEARELVTKLYRQTPVLDSGARAAAATFVGKNIGDVHLAWENEARLEIAEAGGGLDLIYPPLSMLAEPPVAVVDANVQRKGTRAAAEAYLTFLYSDEAQEIIAKLFYRPVRAEILKRHAETFPDLKLFPITAVAKSWEDAQQKFFAEGKVFDSIYKR